MGILPTHGYFYGWTEFYLGAIAAIAFMFFSDWKFWQIKQEKQELKKDLDASFRKLERAARRKL